MGREPTAVQGHSGITARNPVLFLRHRTTPVNNMRLQTTEKPTYALLRSSLCALSIAVAGLLASGCDSGGPSSSSSATVSSQAKIEGNISDIHGPITQGKFEVKDKNDKLIMSQTLDGASNHYAITVPAGTAYPILLVVTPPPGPASQVVRAVVTSPLADRMDISDITSLIVDAALALGGLTETNIAKASGSAIGMRQRQGVSASAGGGGAGPGQSAGGVSRGGHGGHDMSGGGPAPATPSTPSGGAMQNMQH